MMLGCDLAHCFCGLFGNLQINVALNFTLGWYTFTPQFRVTYKRFVLNFNVNQTKKVLCLYKYIGFGEFVPYVNIYF